MDERLEAVEAFYDFHPISARQILDAVAARGIATDAITEAVLVDHDQDHYGGVAAVDRLIDRLQPVADDHLLDVCSGMGGPARYVAWRRGCRVTGLDLTVSRVAGATELTRLARLDDRVDFVNGNALAMPFPDGRFSAALAQEAFAHVPDKPRLIGECARVLRSGGRIAFTDITHDGRLPASDARRLYDGMRFSEIATPAQYSGWLRAEGMRIVALEDLSAEWTRILVERHAMYRSLEAATVARLGREHFDRYDRAYAHFVGLYESGVLGGTLVHAVKD